MNEFSTIHAVVATLIFLAGLSARFVFDQLGRQWGWAREDRKAQGEKIEAVDKAARDTISRVERELGAQVGALTTKVNVLDERVKHLPTADDIEEVNRRLSDLDRAMSTRLGALDRDVGAATAKIDGMNVNVKTVLDHILAGEGRR